MADEKQSGACGSSECNSDCSSCGSNPDLAQQEQERNLARRLDAIKNKIIVMSGKGGVGKSTVTVNLATALAKEGKQVGILDVDFHGPSIPVMLGLQEARAEYGSDGILPVKSGNIKVMSISFLLEKQDAAVIWRGAMKTSAIKQLISDVDWGMLDYLIIDSPPGTGDEPLSVCQTIKDITGAVIVTTPQEVALADVRRSINFCSQLEMPVLGVIENMSGYACTKCGEIINVFGSGGGELMAQQMEARFLGKIPLDPEVVESADLGKAYVKHASESAVAKAFGEIVKPLLELDK